MVNFTYGQIAKRRMAGDQNFEARYDMIRVSIEGIENFHKLFHYPLEIRKEFFDVISLESFMMHDENQIKVEAAQRTERYIH